MRCYINFSYLPSPPRGELMSMRADDWSLPAVTDEIVERYRANYHIPATIDVTADQVRQHMELEYRLTQKMLSSRPDERTKVWVESYDELYGNLPWINHSSSAAEHSVNNDYYVFLELIPPGSKVIDIGSGHGTLARYLTEHGRPCVATEITAERGLREAGSPEWHSTDGIHLDAFEPAGTYDAVVSTQVVEHFHPDDVEAHLRGAFAVLRPGGRYVLNTPHRFLGPADLSRVFSLDRPHFMHLKEYTYRELGDAARRAGFHRIEAVYIPPGQIRKRIPFMLHSRLLYRYLTTMERIIGDRRLPRKLLYLLLFRVDLFVSFTKGASR